MRDSRKPEVHESRDINRASLSSAGTVRFPKWRAVSQCDIGDVVYNNIVVATGYQMRDGSVSIQGLQLMLVCQFKLLHSCESTIFVPVSVSSSEVHLASSFTPHRTSAEVLLQQGVKDIFWMHSLLH